MDRRKAIQTLLWLGGFAASYQALKPIAAIAQDITAPIDGDDEKNWKTIEKRTEGIKSKTIVELHSIDSEAFGLAINFKVLLPPDYYAIGNNRRYGVVYMHCGYSGSVKGSGPNGGCNYWPVWCFASKTLDNLRAGHVSREDMIFKGNSGNMTRAATDEEIEEMNQSLKASPWEDYIIVCVWNPSTMLGADFGKYEFFLTEELIRYIDQKFRTINHRSFRATDGACSGSSVSMGIAMKNPELFGYAGGVQIDVHDYHARLTEIFKSNYKRIIQAGGISIHINTNEGDDHYKINGEVRPQFQDFLNMLNQHNVPLAFKVFALGGHGYNAYRFPNGHESFYWWGKTFRQNRNATNIG